jgi:hypothetical protein
MQAGGKCLTGGVREMMGSGSGSDFLSDIKLCVR